jgi:hypothetical protein
VNGWDIRGPGSIIVPGVQKGKKITYIACLSLRKGLIGH